MPKHLVPVALATLLLTACGSMERTGPPAPIVEAPSAQAPEPAEAPKPAEPKAPPAPKPTQVYAYTPPEEIPDTPAESAAETQTTKPTTDAAQASASSPKPDQPTPKSPATTASSTKPPPAAPPQTAERQTGTLEAPASEPASPAAATTPPAASSGTSAPPAPEVAAAAPPQPGLAPSDMPPAVASLAQRAEQQRQAGDAGGAAATLERALRIQPQEAYLWNRLARVRMEQGMSDSAAKLATRSNALTGDEPALKTNNWEIIATARRQSGDIDGAVEAERKAAGG